MVVVASLCVAVHGLNVDFARSLGLVENLDSKRARSLADRVVETAEAEVWVFLVFFEGVRRFVLSADDFVLADGLFAVVHRDGLAVVDPLDQGRALKP